MVDKRILQRGGGGGDLSDITHVAPDSTTFVRTVCKVSKVQEIVSLNFAVRN